MRGRLLSLVVISAVLATGLSSAGNAVGAQQRKAGVAVAADTTAGPDTDLSGPWNVTEVWDNIPAGVSGHIQKWVYTYTETSPGIYSVNNGAGWTTTDIPISGSSFVAWFCGNGGTYSNDDKPDCPLRSGYWLLTWNFEFPPGGPNTAEGTFCSYLPLKPDAGNCPYGHGTFTAVQQSIATGLSVSVSLSRSTVAVGAQVDAAVTVTAVGGDMTSVSLGQGLAISSGAARVSQAPQGLSGFDLTSGTSRTFDFTLVGVQAGTVTLSASATGTSKGGPVQGSGSLTLTVVPGSPLLVLVSLIPKVVDLAVVPDSATSDNGEPVQATVRIKNNGKAPLDNVNIVDRLLIGYDDGGPKVPVVPLRQHGGPTLDQGGKSEAAGDLGSLAPGQVSSPITFDLIANGDGGYSVEALATADKPGGGFLHGTGQASLKVNSPVLEYDAKAPDVQEGLRAAGVPWTIDITMQDLSYRKSVVVFPQFAGVDNAEVGPLIGEAGAIPQQDSSASCQPPDAVQLSPREEENYRLVVYTSGPGLLALGAKAGGTRSAVIDNLPVAGIVNESGTGFEKAITPNDVEMDPDPGSRLFASLSDRGIPEYKQNYSLFSVSSNLAIGAIEGLTTFTWGLVTAIPNLLKLAASAIRALPTYVLNLWQYLAETWGYMKEDPALMSAGLVAPLSVIFLTMVDRAPALKGKVQQVIGGLNDAIANYMTPIATDWSEGNYNGLARDMAADSVETGLNVATLVAPVASCLMTRSAQFFEALNAARAAAFAKAADAIGDLAGLVSWTTAAAKVEDLVLGMQLTYRQLAQLYGLTEEQVNFLREFAKDNHVLITVRSRAAQAITWLKEGAVLKPEQIKIKSVSWLDTQFLGYRPSDLGRIVLRKPISPQQLAENLVQAGVQPGSATYKNAFKQLATRVSEYEHPEGGFAAGSGGYYKDLETAAKKDKMTLRWNLADNSVNPNVAENGFTTYEFRLFDEGDGNFVPQFRVEGAGPCIPPACIDGWRSVTGDVDFLSMTDPRGYGLPAETRVELYSQLAGGNPVNMLHPAADTWTIPAIDGDAEGGDFWFPVKENEFARAGNVPQFNPSGAMPTVVKFNPFESYFTSANDYRVGFLGGYEGPLPEQGPVAPAGVVEP